MRRKRRKCYIRKNRHTFQAKCVIYAGELLARCSFTGTQVGLAGRWESPYSIIMLWTHRVRQGKSTLGVIYVQARTSLISIQPPYSMRRRTIPRADTRKRHVYYDWDQRPCPSPPLPNSWGHYQKRRSRGSSKISSGAPRQPWETKNFLH